MFRHCWAIWVTIDTMYNGWNMGVNLREVMGVVSFCGVAVETSFVELVIGLINCVGTPVLTTNDVLLSTMTSTLYDMVGGGKVVGAGAAVRPSLFADGAM